jgi:hypothetical protein
VKITTRGADFYEWGYLKGTIYWKRANTRDGLWRLIEATGKIIRNIFGSFFSVQRILGVTGLTYTLKLSDSVFSISWCS